MNLLQNAVQQIPRVSVRKLAAHRDPLGHQLVAWQTRQPNAGPSTRDEPEKSTTATSMEKAALKPPV